MEYILSSVFLQTLIKHGLSKALAAIGSFALVAVLGYYAKARIDLMRDEAKAAADERARRLAAYEAERSRLFGMIEARDQDIKEQMQARDKMLGNHLAHDEASHDKLAETLTKVQANLEAATKSLNDHRDEEGARAGKVYDKLNALEVKIAEAK